MIRAMLRKMTRNIRQLFTLAVPIGALALVAFWLIDTGFGRRGGSLTYDTGEVSRGPIRKVISTSGPVRALVTVSVGSQLSGQIAELKADFNSEVKADEVLAVIDDKSFVAKVAQAKADLAAAKAMLTTQQAALAKAEAVYLAAERLMGRQQTLAGKGIASTAALDTALRDADVAKADIVVAKAQIENATAQIAQREAQLQQAEIDLERTRIRSPIDGTVIARSVDVGQTVAASLQAPELFKIAQDLRLIRIEAQVNEADVGAVKEGNPAEFTVDAYPERKFRGTVTQVRLAATELQNVVTYTVIIEAANEGRRLFPGMTANVQIETDKRDNVLRISNDALRFKPRDRVAAAAPRASWRSEGGERGERLLERLKDELHLNEHQVATVRAELKKLSAETRGQNGERASQGGAEAGQRARFVVRLEQVLQPVLSEEQRPLFDRWKRGRENTRTATVWVLAESGEPESRFVRLGLSDDQFTEVLGSQLKEGERVIVRAREAKNK
jgi:HlyD family secretion protein